MIMSVWWHWLDEASREGRRRVDAHSAARACSAAAATPHQRLAASDWQHGSSGVHRLLSDHPMRARPPQPRARAASSEDEAREVGLGHHVAHLRVDVRRIDRHGVSGVLARRERDLLDHALEDRVYPACADVLDVAVDLRRELRDAAERAVLEGEVDCLRLHEGHLLAHQRRLGLGEDAVQVVLRELLQLDADGQPPLQLGEQVGRLALVEGARAHEQDVVRVDVAVLRAHRRALDQREQIALHALGRRVS
mmetsp:Transcript_7139/g.18279  ORF Transcript_7139/g.18279 Transcript_7139/m.18279 type:complete len:251 (-) Transcript_7139:1044-1796(-)